MIKDQCFCTWDKPISYRIDTKSMIQKGKYKSMPVHPMKERIDVALGSYKATLFIRETFQGEYQTLIKNTIPSKSTNKNPVPQKLTADSMQISTINGLTAGYEYKKVQK